MLDTSSERTGQPSTANAAFDTYARDRLVEQHMDLAWSLARRFAGWGEQLDDLRQVAMLGLVTASHRFDPSRGYAFSTFATPTIIGTLKRHLRDHAWAIRPPRSLQERYLAVNAAVDALTSELRRAPDTAEIASYGDWSQQEVRGALGERLHRNLEHWDALEGGAGREPARSISSLLSSGGWGWLWRSAGTVLALGRVREWFFRSAGVRGSKPVTLD
jgi:RNA polymerase sigma factor (sigma-70 family)